MKKMFLTSIFLLMISFTIVVPAVYAVTDPGYQPGDVPIEIRNKIDDAWATVAVIIRMLAVGCVLFAGLRYMFASADQKADIKHGLIYLAIGAILVFSTTLIIDLVKSTTNQITK